MTSRLERIARRLKGFRSPATCTRSASWPSKLESSSRIREISNKLQVASGAKSTSTSTSLSGRKSFLNTEPKSAISATIQRRQKLAISSSEMPSRCRNLTRDTLGSIVGNKGSGVLILVIANRTFVSSLGLRWLLRKALEPQFLALHLVHGMIAGIELDLVVPHIWPPILHQ